MRRDYERLDIVKFGTHLLESGDLDPVYIALSKMDWRPGQLERWLVAYWCFYHCGVASYLSEFEGREFWDMMRVAAANDTPTILEGRWPRGSERRHFRGNAAIDAIDKLRYLYGEAPEALVEELAAPRAEADIHDHATVLPFAVVAERAKKLPLFGPWISFKVADMLDRLGIVQVDFDKAAVFMFADPVKAALILWRQHLGLPESAKPKNQEEAINSVVSYLQMTFRDHTAPPLHDRIVNIQEIETILCKWKSHLNGHYPLNNDITEIREGTAPWANVCETALHFVSRMPTGAV